LQNGTNTHIWLRHCATSRKVAGSIPGGVIHKTYCLEDKGDRCIGLTTLTPTCADILEICVPPPPGALRACLGSNRDRSTISSLFRIKIMEVHYSKCCSQCMSHYTSSVCCEENNDVLWYLFPCIKDNLYYDNQLNGRSQCPRGPRRGSTATHLLRSWVRIPTGAWMFVCCVCVCVVRLRSLRRADHSSRAVLPTMARRCV
jgi:hypothetical protein